MNPPTSPPVILCIAINTTSAGTFHATRNFYVEYAQGAPGGTRIVLVVPASPEFAEFASRGAVTVVRYPLGRGVMRLLRRLWFELVWVRGAVGRYRPAGVIVLGNYSVVPLPVRKAALMRHPYLVDRAAVRRLGYGRRRLQEWLRRLAFRRTLSTTRDIIVQSQAMGSALARTFAIEPGRIHVVPNPVPDYMLRARSEPVAGLPDRARTLLYPSRYNEHKNHELIVELAVRHRRRLAELDLRFLVTLRADSRTAPLLRRIREAGADDLVVNLGELPQPALVDHYRTAVGLFFPSRAETYPNALPEAMCFGLPIAVADRPYARVICADAAVYFEDDRPAAALAAIESMLADWETWSARSRSAAAGLPSARDWGERVLAICSRPP
ncbi:MAG TPA: glycosyltransferase [Steroidobacteraceae bacterium]